jgi:hypothetical protein
MSTTKYLPVNRSANKVGPVFDFESVATMWIVTQLDSQNWTVEPVASEALREAA